MVANQYCSVNTSDKPTNRVDYSLWLRDSLGVAITNTARAYYEAAAAKIKHDFDSSSFWQSLKKHLREYNDEYIVTTTYPLLVNPDEIPELKVKPWSSFADKTYRENVIRNTNWPGPPPDGWIVPDNWYARIHDIVRTTIVVKYLDGVKFLAEKLESLCGGEFDHCDWEAKDEGYYAAHLYVKQEFELPPAGFDTVRESVRIEIQVTTQIQEVIRKLLHKYYEDKRSKILDVPGVTWQWDYRGEEFMANYLGHILHYVEGMIMEVRDRERRYEEV